MLTTTGASASERYDIDGKVLRDERGGEHEAFEV